MFFCCLSGHHAQSQLNGNIFAMVWGNPGHESRERTEKFRKKAKKMNDNRKNEKKTTRRESKHRHTHTQKTLENCFEQMLANAMESA